MNENSSMAKDCCNPCPICLQSVNVEAYLDRCFHKFCYQCISQWEKLVTSKHYHSSSSIQCPVCKRDNFSIIYGCEGGSFKQYYINQEKGFSFSNSHRYRLQCYHSELPAIMYQKFCVPQYWRCHRCLHPNRWLQNWLKREIQALLQEEDVGIIIHHILGVVESFLMRCGGPHVNFSPEQKRDEFRTLIYDAARPFLFGRTERFVNEVELFLASGLNLEAYDEVYLQYLGSDASSATGEDAEVHDQTTEIRYLHLFDDEDVDRTD